MTTGARKGPDDDAERDEAKMATSGQEGPGGETAALGPTKTSNWIRLELPALAENTALVRVAVASLAAQLDFTLPELEEIRVATSEAFSNAVLHAYPDPGGAGTGTVTVEAHLVGQVLEVSLADRGVGIADVTKARQPAYTTRADRMGLGFAFMESFMDEVTVRTAPGSGTRVVMRKRCPARRQTASSTGVAGSGGRRG